MIGGRSGGLGWWYTPDDTLDKLDPELLARDARLYATMLLRLCAEPILTVQLRRGGRTGRPHRRLPATAGRTL
jgi:hypothetical protein